MVNQVLASQRWMNDLRVKGYMAYLRIGKLETPTSTPQTIEGKRDKLGTRRVIIRNYLKMLG